MYVRMYSLIAAVAVLSQLWLLVVNASILITVHVDSRYFGLFNHETSFFDQMTD